MINVQLSTDYKKYVEKAFNDVDFLNLYKDKNNLNSLKDCVNHHVNLFYDMLNFKFYTIYDNDLFISYFGSEESNNFKYLTTFYIDKNYRNKDFYNKFLDVLHDNLGNIFCAYRDNTNIKAENFLKKLGGKCILDNNDLRIYIFNRSV